MANITDRYELEGLREDFKNLLGIHDEGGSSADTFTQAKTLVTITRIVDKGPLNTSTGKYDNPNTKVIYTGPAHVSPVTYRRDRQEIGGMEAVRIRQYRAVVPWDAGDIWIDDRLTVNFTEDPDMEGRTFDISDVLYESELAARRLSLTDTHRDGEGEAC